MVQKSSPERQHEFDVAYMKMAMAIASLSTAIKKQVGSIVVSKDDQIISQGFNGTPHGLTNVCEEVLWPDGRLENFDNRVSELKKIADGIKCGLYKDVKLKTKPFVLHAESNAISKCAKYISSTKGGTLYVTLSPCVNCAKLIVQAEIERVVYLEKFHDETGIEILQKCGIVVEQLKM